MNRHVKRHKLANSQCAAGVGLLTSSPLDFRFAQSVMASVWEPAQSAEQVPAACAEIASVLSTGELLDSVRCPGGRRFSSTLLVSQAAFSTAHIRG